MTLIKKFDVESNDEKSLLNGILSYIKDNNLFPTLSANSRPLTDSPKYSIDVLDVDSTINFWTKNEINSSFSFTFSSHKIKATSYTLRGLDKGGTHNIACQSKHWLFEGFHPIKKKWIILDDHSSNELHGFSKIYNYPITQNFGIYSSFRLFQLGTNERDDYFLCLRNIEVFGYLYSNDYQLFITENSILNEIINIQSILFILL